MTGVQTCALPISNRSIAQTFGGVGFNVSSRLYDFVADLIACRLYFFMSAVACSSEAAEWVPRVAAVNGACCS